MVTATVGGFLLLLLPGLAKSKPDVSRIVCSNNLRRLGTAAVAYAQENLNYLAFPNWDGGGTYAGQTVPGWLYTVTNGAIPDPGPGGPYAGNPPAAYKTGLWFTYLQDPRVYLCPADIRSPTFVGPFSRNQRLSSYIMNGAACGYGLAVRPRLSGRVTDVWNPRCYLLWGPDENAVGHGNPGAFAFNDGAMYPMPSEGSPERLHTLAGCEVLAVSGGVSFVTLKQFRMESAAPGKSLAWWSPFSTTGH